MDRALHLSTNPLTDYELESIRMERVLDGGRKEHADAPLPTDEGTDKVKGRPDGSNGAAPSGRKIKPLD